MADINLSSVRLPPAFQECEWIGRTEESGGKPYINTGVNPDQDTSVIVDGQFVRRIGYIPAGIFGAMDSYNFGFYLDTWTNGYATGGYGSSGARPGQYVRVYNYDRTKYKMLKNRLYFDESLVYEYPTGTFTVNKPIYILANNGSAGTDGFFITFASQVLADTEVIRDYVPCYLKQAWNGIAAGTIGMYDLCGSLSSNGTPFYTNEGTGTFAKGQDVVHADWITINGKEVDKMTDATGAVWEKHKLYLYKDGDECVDVTGGWINPALYTAAAYQDCSDYYAAAKISYEREKQSDRLHLYCKYRDFNDSPIASFRTESAVDCSGYSYICIDADLRADNNSPAWVRMTTTIPDGTQDAFTARTTNNLVNGITKLEIADGESFYISVLATANTEYNERKSPAICGADIKRIWLE